LKDRAFNVRQRNSIVNFDRSERVNRRSFIERIMHVRIA